MPRFEDVYLPLAQDIINVQDEIAGRDERNIGVVVEDDPSAEFARRAYQNYLGSLAYHKAYRAFMEDEGGPASTTEAIDAMHAELTHLEAELRGEEIEE